MVNQPVLVLNQNYEPLNVCRVRRAILLVLLGRAEALENGRGELHSVDRFYEVPSVIRLNHNVRRPLLKPKLSKMEIFNRDHHACQYCGREVKELTLDHIVPRKHGGQHTWENLVAACVPCNRQKAGRTPQEAGMKLLRPAQAPKRNKLNVPDREIRKNEEWKKYFGKEWLN